MIIAFKGFIHRVRDESFILNVNNIFYEIKATKKVLDTLHQGDETVIFICRRLSNLYGFLEEQDMINFKEIIISNPNMPPNVILSLLNGNPSLNKDDIAKTLHQEAVKVNVNEIKTEVISACKNLGFGIKEAEAAFERVRTDQLGGKNHLVLEYSTQDVLPYVLEYLKGAKK